MKAVVVLFAFCTIAAPAGSSELDHAWTMATSMHFEVYTDAGPVDAQRTLRAFEKLRAVFQAHPLSRAIVETPPAHRLRIIQFRSRQQFENFQTPGSADAYYRSSAERDYIVMPVVGERDFAVESHEYAHALLHEAALRLPRWLEEGIAEVASTASIKDSAASLGGPIAMRTESLRRHSWLTAAALFQASSPISSHRNNHQTDIFYAESWIVVDMLMADDRYAGGFDEVVRTLRSSTINSQDALRQVYGLAPETIVATAHNWLAHGCSTPRQLTLPTFHESTTKQKTMARNETQALLGGLLAANGQFNRAEEMYQDLLRQTPANPEWLAALGIIRLQQGDRQGAVQYWRSAFDDGLTDPVLCYRYAMLADQTGLAATEVEKALERTLQSDPTFDDALYRLALLKNNAGEYPTAANLLQRMTAPSSDRAFAYWAALSYAFMESGNREGSERAAQKAAQAANSNEERVRAAELAHIATTDVVVRVAHGGDGKQLLVTTRIPHGETQFNPFVEPNDRMQTAEGTLEEIQCDSGKLISIRVGSEAGNLLLTVPDPTQVLVQNGPAAFNCGIQSAIGVTVQYAAAATHNAGILRALRFH